MDFEGFQLVLRASDSRASAVRGAESGTFRRSLCRICQTPLYGESTALTEYIHFIECQTPLYTRYLECRTPFYTLHRVNKRRYTMYSDSVHDVVPSARTKCSEVRAREGRARGRHREPAPVGRLGDAEERLGLRAAGALCRARGGK